MQRDHHVHRCRSALEFLRFVERNFSRGWEQLSRVVVGVAVLSLPVGWFAGIPSCREGPQNDLRSRCGDTPCRCARPAPGTTTHETRCEDHIFSIRSSRSLSTFVFFKSITELTRSDIFPPFRLGCRIMQVFLVRLIAHRNVVIVERLEDGIATVSGRRVLRRIDPRRLRDFSAVARQTVSAPTNQLQSAKPPSRDTPLFFRCCRCIDSTGEWRNPARLMAESRTRRGRVTFEVLKKGRESQQWAIHI